MGGRLRAVALGLAIIPMLCSVYPVGAADSPDTNKDVVLRYYDLFNATTTGGLGEVVAANVVHHNLMPGLPAGVDGVTQQVAAYHTAFPDIEVTVVDIVAEGDRVAVRAFVTGTQRAVFAGVPASGRAVAFEMMAIYRIADGKIAEAWEVSDLLTLMVQVGAISSPGAPPHVLPSTAPKGTADLAANKAVAQRFSDLFNASNLDALSPVVDASVVDHDPGPGQANGIEGVKQSLRAFRVGFPDLRLTVTDVIAEGDKVVVHGISRGTNTGSFFGIPASGKAVAIESIDIDRIANGKIVEIWHIEDVVGALGQISMGSGVLASPPPSSTGPAAAPVAPPSSVLPPSGDTPYLAGTSGSPLLTAPGPRQTGAGYYTQPLTGR